MTIALLHGGAHGSWCWDLLRPELERLGHRTAAPDLPLDDASQTLTGLADVAAAALTGLPDLVVVAHSAAGTFLPLVAARADARAMVFLCALVPAPGRSWLEVVATDPISPVDAPPGEVAVDDLGRVVFGPDLARHLFYADCPEAVSTWASGQLRPFAPGFTAEPFPADGWPAVPAHLVHGQDDAGVRPEWSRWVAEHRLHTTPIALPGGHSPFLARPADLAAVLDRLVRA